MCLRCCFVLQSPEGESELTSEIMIILITMIISTTIVVVVVVVVVVMTIQILNIIFVLKRNIRKQLARPETLWQEPVILIYIYIYIYIHILLCIYIYI